MISQTSRKILGLVIISLVFLNGCGSSILLDTPQAAITTATSSPTAHLTSTSTFVATFVTASTTATAIATINPSTPLDTIIPNAIQTSVTPNSTAPAFTSHAVACVTSQSGTGLPAEVQAETLIFSSFTLGAGPYLPLANGQEILFSGMRSFEVKQVLANPYRITIEITFLTGETITDDVPVFNSTDAHLEGKAKFGEFFMLLPDVKKVEFQPQGDCP